MKCIKCGVEITCEKCEKCGFDFTSEPFVCFHTKKDVNFRLKEYAVMYDKNDKGYEDILMAVKDEAWIGDLLKHKDEKMVKRYSLAAEQGHSEAQYNLGWLLFEKLAYGRLFWIRNREIENESDYEFVRRWECADQVFKATRQEGIKWLRLAAEQGHAEAQYMLGKNCDGRLSTADKDDIEEAVKWYRLAAKQKHIGAMLSLGECYLIGQGSLQDYKEAAKCFKFVVNHADKKKEDYLRAEAGLNLGELYKNGWGVGQDYNEAMNWYRFAAEDWVTSEKARKKIGEMYKKGHGVPKSYMQYLKCKKCAKQKWPIKNCTVSCESTHL